MLQYTNWVIAPYPTELNRVNPILTWVEPPTPLEGSHITNRQVTFQWKSDKKSCLFQYKGSWQNDWCAWTSSNTYTSLPLPNNTYSFSVRTKDLYGNISSVIIRQFIVFRELSIPEPISPALNTILSDTAVNFVCTVPPGETGQTYHFEFQIAYDAAMTDLVDPKIQWFSSINGYSDFNYNAPIPQNRGGTVSFFRTLQTRKKYWWRCRVRFAGTDQVSSASEIIPFTVGTIGEKITLTAIPNRVRADGFSKSIVRASIENRLGQLDVQWNGSILITRDGIQTSLPINSGLSSMEIASATIRNETIIGEADGLESGNVSIEWVANRLPEAPTWLPENIVNNINPNIISATANTVTMTIPMDLDNDALHLKIEIDTVNSFDSPDLMVSETRFDRSGWEYYDGIRWIVFPTNGVTQGTGLARYTTIMPLVDNKTYYCRVAAWDNYEL